MMDSGMTVQVYAAPLASRERASGHAGPLKALVLAVMMILLLPAMLLVALVAILVPSFLRVPVCGPSMTVIRAPSRR